MTRGHEIRLNNTRWGLKAGLLGCVAAAALSVNASPARAEPGNFYFFGDSSTGQGNWSALVGNRDEDHFPYSSNNGFARETNGLIWAEMLGRDVDIILDPDLDSSNINFAISGAHMTTLGDLSAYGLDTGVQNQVAIFADLVAAGEITPTQNDVFFVLAGANDFLDRFPAGETIEAITADVAAAAADNIANLASLGAETILLSEMQPIDYAPEFASDPEARAFWEAASRNANAAIAEAVADADVDVNLVTVKYRAMLEHIRDNAAALGIANITDSCFDGEQLLCAETVEGQNEYLFLDDLHFTERAQLVEAQWFGATLDAATGEASRHAARIPDVAQYELESILRRVGRNQGDRKGKVSLYGDFLYDSPLLANGDLRSLTEDDFKVGLIGAEMSVSDRIFAGLALSLTRSDVTSLTGSYDSGTEMAHGYVGVRQGPFLVRAGGTYGWMDIDNFNRDTGVALLSANGHTKGRLWDMFGEVGVSARWARISIDANAAFHASRIKVDGFAETGANGLALSYSDQVRKSRRLEANLGLKYAGWNLAKHVQLKPVADINYRRELTEGDYTLASNLIANTANAALFQTDGVAADRLSGMFGVDLEIADAWRIAARFEKTWADDVADAQAVSVSMRWKF